MKVLILLAGVLSSMLIAGIASSQPLDSGGVPTVITSDKMEYDHDKRTVRFTGSVKVDRPDFVLHSRELVVVFAKEVAQTSGSAVAGDQAEKIEQIIAQGEVRFEHEGRIGHCERAVYDVKKEVLRMEGSPSLKDGKNEIRGKIITFSLKDNRSEIIGGEDSRVEAIFFAPNPDESE